MKVGLKLWSTNVNYVPNTRVLLDRGIVDYVELFVVPGSLGKLEQWEGLKAPYILHAPHSYTGFNPALREKEKDNRAILNDVDAYFRRLKPEAVIFHPGIAGDLQESARQFKAFRADLPDLFAAALMENKPALGHKNERCCGASPDEVRFILVATGFGFCLDFGHAVCYSVWAAKEWRRVVEEFMALKPGMFHLSDGYLKPYDEHRHLGQGELDIAGLVALIPSSGRVTLETPKDSIDDLDDVAIDVKELRRYAGEHS